LPASSSYGTALSVARLAGMSSSSLSESTDGATPAMLWRRASDGTRTPGLPPRPLASCIGSLRP
jgi:hypothetical protein